MPGATPRQRVEPRRGTADRAEVLLRCMAPGRLSRSLNLLRQSERIPGTKFMLETPATGRGVEVDEGLLASMGMGGGL